MFSNVIYLNASLPFPPHQPLASRASQGLCRSRIRELLYLAEAAVQPWFFSTQTCEMMHQHNSINSSTEWYEHICCHWFYATIWLSDDKIMQKSDLTNYSLLFLIFPIDKAFSAFQNTFQQISWNSFMLCVFLQICYISNVYSSATWVSIFDVLKIFYWEKKS